MPAYNETGLTMIDLRAFYLEHVQPDDYCYRFHELVDKVNMTHNVFSGYHETDSAEFLVFDAEEAIEKFRELCQPGNEMMSKEDRCWFYLISYFLDFCGYYIEQFPRVLSRPPEDPSTFTYGDIRNWAFRLVLNDGNTITYAVRRQLVAEMKFVKRSTTLEVGASLDEQFRMISTRDASFQDMSTDEKIQEIANLIEAMLKGKNGFIQLDYTPVAFGYIDDDTIKQFRKQVQCFRHASEQSIAERAAFTEEQKSFLIDYGTLICKTIHALRQPQQP